MALWRMISCALFLLPQILGRPIYTISRIKDEIAQPPRDWVFQHHADPNQPITLEISLVEQNLADFEQLVLDVSDPTNPAYGHHLKAQDVADMLHPTDETTDSVIQWLNSYGLSYQYSANEWITFTANVSTAEVMLSTRFGWYLHVSSGRRSMRTLGYSVPKHLYEHINFLSPTTRFPTGHWFMAAGTARSIKEHIFMDGPFLTQRSNPSCADIITPPCLLKLYNVHYAPPAATLKDNKLAFASFSLEYARYKDLEKFENLYTPYAKGHNFTVLSINGGKNNQTSDALSVEANGDVETLAGVGYPVPLYELSTAGSGPLIPDAGEPAGSMDNEPYLQFLKGVLALSDDALPQTISISYIDDEQTWTESVARKVCNMFAQLGGRGVSVLFASGDSGPCGAVNDCENSAQTKKQYTPVFPASCPFLTAVGGTQSIPETTASISGGGFSNYFAMPAYQKTVVQAYLSAQPAAFRKYYNASGRGFPDVAAQAINLIMIDKGEVISSNGTSGAAPTVAAIVALLNSARISQGKPTLGFLNPLLYQNPGALNDITTGMSTTSGQIPGGGWNATKGWDAATGLGTPNFDKLLKLVAPGVQNTGGPVS